MSKSIFGGGGEGGEGGRRPLFLLAAFGFRVGGVATQPLSVEGVSDVRGGGG
jgi:hypothetical protein